MRTDGFRFRRLMVIVLGLYGLYLLLGWLSGPLLRQPVLNLIETETGRRASLDSLVINPFTLSLTARDFRLQDHDDQPLLAFDRLHVNFELSSLFRRSWHFRELAWEGPRLRLVRQDADTFNISYLFATAENAEADSGDSSPESAAFSLPAMSVQQLRLVQGGVLYRDQHRPEPAELDLSPLDFVLEDFSTRAVSGEGNHYSLSLVGPEGGRLDWTGQLNLEPLVLEGELALSGLDTVPWVAFLLSDEPWQLVSAELDTALHYRLALESAGPVLQVQEGRFSLKDVRLHWRDEDEPALSLPQLTLAGVSLDTAAQRLHISSLQLQQPMLRLRQQTQGVDWVQAFDSAEGSTGADTDDAADDNVPWHWQLDTIGIQQGTLQLEDHTLETVAVMPLSALNLALGPLSSAAKAAFGFQASARLTDHGDLHLQGEGQLQPFTAELQLSTEALELAVVQPWLNPLLNRQLASGRVKTTLALSLPESLEDWRLHGDVQLDALQLDDGEGQPLLTWSSLAVETLSLDAAEHRISIDSIHLKGLKTAYQLDTEGQDNWADLLKPSRDDSTAPKDSESASESVSATPAWQLRFNRLQLSDADLAYRDERTTPVFDISLSRLGGQLDHWDMNSRRPSRLNLNARVNRQAPLALSGTLRPAADALAVDMHLQLQDYAMTGLTPFTGRFVGFAVERGQLNLDSSIKLEGTVLESRTGVRASNFYLGDRVESPDAVNLPVKLGLTVLRDRQGLIDLPVAINGDLSDPSVTVTGLIMRALLNIISRAATAPFSMLTSLAGGGADLQHISFPAGSADLNSQAQTTVQALFKVMNDRPALNLQLRGQFSPADGDALVAESLGREWAGEGWPGLELALHDRRLRRQMLRAYERQNLGSVDTLPAIGDDPEAVETHQARIAFQALVRAGRDSLPAERLQQLADTRADTLREHLQGLGLAAERMRLEKSATDAVEQGSVWLGVTAP